jgi:acetylornithine/succinyldiaminopimelate/putrescine aminotransferase
VALETIDEPSLLDRVSRLGQRLRDGLSKLDGIEDVRGRGLMVGATLAAGLDAAEVARRALDGGLVINVPGERMLRFLPPLVIDEEQVDEALAKLAAALA